MKKYGLFIFVILFILFFSIPIVNASTNDEYYLNGYDINIVVNENNSLNITETIGVYFNIPKHGIVRRIPLKNEVVRLDGTTSKNMAKISDIKVSENYYLSTEDYNQVIRIGDENFTVTGQKNYGIGYIYDLGRDRVKEYDELYFNLIGNHWDTSISNITFSITMPKDFDSSKLGFSAGVVGSTDSSRITYDVKDNVISGKYNGVINPGEALTVRLELPEGYFINEGSNYYLMFIVPFLGLFLSFVIWMLYGKDDPVVETVEFYPPEGFNSLEVGFLYSGNADNKDVTSLLIYLANKGYIKITELENKDFVITKIKDYDGENENERRFFEGLFKNCDSLESIAKNNSEISVTKDDLFMSFYTTMNKILSNINKRKNKKLIFDEKSSKKTIFIILFLIISLITTVSIPTLEYALFEELLLTIFICLFYIPFYAVGLSNKIPKSFRVVWLGFTFVHSFIFFSTLPIVDAMKNDNIYLIGVVFGICAIIGMVIFIKLMSKRTAYGNEMLGKLKGFKRFLETAEKEKLESMVLENPTYFYDILPYTYVLGVSDKWIKKFETITLGSPDWYEGYSSFNTSSFGGFMNSTMTSATRAMSSGSSSSNGTSFGGGSSGGGSSGGGSGGGGGSSW